MKMKKMDYEDFFNKKTDAIYNAAMNLANLLHTTNLQDMNEDSLAYDQEIAGSISESAEEILSSMLIGVCNPYYTDEELPCYSEEECNTLERCPFRS